MILRRRTMMKKKGYPNGVYIQRSSCVFILRTDRKLYFRSEWNPAWNSEAVGVAVVTPEARFVIAKAEKSNIIWSNNLNTVATGIVTSTDTPLARYDYLGESNTDKIINQLTDRPAVDYCRNYTFLNDKKGYLPALGELNQIYLNKTDINSCMTLIGGVAMDDRCRYWASTQGSTTYGWTVDWSNGNMISTYKDGSHAARALSSLDPNITISSSNGKLYTRAEWNTAWNEEAIGVAVISDNCEFVISPSDIKLDFYWDYYKVLIPGIVTTTDESTAKKDYAGSFNTDEIARILTGYASAAGYCKAYVFKHGKTGYLGSLGEWQKVLDNKSEIIACMSLMGGELNAAVYYWTSTQYSKYDAWTMRLNDARVTQWEKETILSIRAFAALDPF